MPHSTNAWVDNYLGFAFGSSIFIVVKADNIISTLATYRDHGGMYVIDYTTFYKRSLVRGNDKTDISARGVLPVEVSPVTCPTPNFSSQLL